MLHASPNARRDNAFQWKWQACRMHNWETSWCRTRKEAEAGVDGSFTVIVHNYISFFEVREIAYLQGGTVTLGLNRKCGVQSRVGRHTSQGRPNKGLARNVARPHKGSCGSHKFPQARRICTSWDFNITGKRQQLKGGPNLLRQMHLGPEVYNRWTQKY